MKSTIGLIFILLIVFTTALQGQDCTQKLRLAQTTYEQGRLHELEALLSNCLTLKEGAGFTTQEKVNAYRYLTLANIYLEDPDKADEAMLNLLTVDKFFEPNEAVDPAEFIALYRKFRHDPLFRAGFKLGPTATMPAITNTYYALGNASGNGKFNPRISISLGFVFEKDFPEFLTDFSIAPEIMFTGRSYNYTNESTTYSDQSLTEIASSIDQNIHKQSWIDLNLLSQYKIVKESTFNPYISLGPGISYLIKSTNQIQTKVGENGITGRAIDTRSSYKSFAYSVIASIGAKIRLGGLYLLGDIRYQYGLNNVVKSSTRSNTEALRDYGYVPSDYRHNNLTIHLGIVFPYFNPKKMVK